MSRKKPNLFIVGAARSGTTSLYQHLKSCGDVFMPEDQLQKEPAFFSDLKKSRFKKFERYMKIFEAANENHKSIGEASTAYLTDPVSAGRIHEYNPEARIIIILRNPALRAYSLYNWMVQEGYEYAETFEEALELEKKRIYKKIPNFYEPEYYYNYLYFNSGLYYEQVKRFIDLFGENVLILKFEDYIKDFNREWGKICIFLNIKPVDHDYSNDSYLNESKQIRSSVIQFVLRKTTDFCLKNQESFKVNKGRDNFKKIIFNRARNELSTLLKEKKINLFKKIKILYILNRSIRRLQANTIVFNRDTKGERDLLMKLGQMDKKPPEIKTKTFRFLQDKYREDIAKLSNLTGVDFL